MRIQFLAPKFSKRLSRRSSSSEVHELRRALTSLPRSEEHTSELQSQSNLVCRLLLEKKKKTHFVIDAHIHMIMSLVLFSNFYHKSLQMTTTARNQPPRHMSTSLYESVT